MTISVQVNFLGYSQDDVGAHKLKVELDPMSNLQTLLKTLAAQLGAKFRKYIYDPTTNVLNENITMIINGRHFTALDGLETPLKSGDDISIFPPLGGG
ncbi:MAG: MoaD family protein [Candidatus Helarchaeota archaeon]